MIFSLMLNSGVVTAVFEVGWREATRGSAEESVG